MKNLDLITKLINEDRLNVLEINALPVIAEEDDFQIRFLEEFKIRLLFQPKMNLVRVETWIKVESNGAYENDWEVYYQYLAKK